MFRPSGTEQSVEATFHPGDAADYFYWTRSSTTAEYYWMCKVTGFDAGTQLKMWIGVDQCGSPITWEWVNVTSPTLIAGTTLEAKVATHASCPEYRLAACVFSVTSLAPCNSSYTLQCRLDSDGNW